MSSNLEKSISLILISFLGLFFELVFIRWLPANVLSLAYFSNIVLISSFLGLGLGCILATRRKDMFHWFPVVLFIAVAIFVSLRSFEVIIPSSASEWIWSSYEASQMGEESKIELGIMPALLIVYLLNASIFTLIGQKVGLLMANFHPIKAYSLDLVGSILGIVAFGLLSFTGGNLNSPIVWFTIGGTICLWFLKDDRLWLGVGVAAIVAVICVVQLNSEGELWSPYYNIQIKHHNDDNSLSLFVNKFFHQRALDFNKSEEARNKYGLAYKLKNPDNVLILGAGTGNDVAVANIHKVPEIDAVEIDPVIAELGRKMHPNNPYGNPNVEVFVDDARSFLKRNDRKYDMIILGTLDSHALLSAMSTVRLDNFVYTKEALEDIESHLDEDGVAVLMFSVPAPWLGEKLLKTASVVFEDPQPLAFIGDQYLFNLMIVGGPGVKGIMADKSIDKSSFKPVPKEGYGVEEISTDDWPYLYLAEKTVPSHYIEAVFMLLVISFLAIFTLSSQKSFTWSSLNFFSLGAAFLLLETKSITSLSLLFGSTWLVNAFVFGSILAMILIANLIVSRKAIKNIEIIYILLGLALVFNFILPADYFLGYGFWARSLLSSLVVALPIFFAAMIFSSHFKSVKEISTMYGFNLMGTVLGGFLEYSSMMTGLNWLYILAGVFYLISFMAFRRSQN